MKYVVVVLLLIAGVLMTTPRVNAEEGVKLAEFPEVTIEEDRPWPGFYLPDLNGDPLSMQDYRGQKILLQIFASW